MKTNLSHHPLVQLALFCKKIVIAESLPDESRWLLTNDCMMSRPLKAIEASSVEITKNEKEDIKHSSACFAQPPAGYRPTPRFPAAAPAASPRNSLGSPR